MKSFRTVFITIAVIFVISFAACAILLSLDISLLHRSVFYLLQRSKYVFLILGISSALIAVIITVAIGKLENTVSEGDADWFNELDDIQHNKNEKTRKMQTSSKRNNAGKSKTKKSSPKNEIDHSISRSDNNKEDHFSFDDCVNVGATYTLPEIEIQNEKTFSCMYCGAKLSKSSKFCDKCGKRIG